MPCCALAACIIAQFILAFHAMKRTLFGPPEGEARNAAVEWRLALQDAPSPVADPRPAWWRSRRAVGGLALAVAVELLLVVGGIYVVIEHFGHGAGHAAHTETKP